MYGYQTSQVQQIADDAVFYISVAGSADFASTSNLSVSNAAAYGLDADQTRAVIADVKNWISGSNKTDQADRPIHLEYKIETMDEVTRDETILRKGSVQQGDLEKELTEKSFWQHFVPYLINKYYGHDSLKGELLEQSVNGDLWNGITNLVLDIYRQMKVVFCDSILDDNNNIIDYSMDNELPVVRLNITYKYRA
jgi:hypothetical protein